MRGETKQVQLPSFSTQKSHIPLKVQINLRMTQQNRKKHNHPKVICTLHFKVISKNNDVAVSHLRPAAYQSTTLPRFI